MASLGGIFDASTGDFYPDLPDRVLLDRDGFLTACDASENIGVTGGNTIFRRPSIESQGHSVWIIRWQFEQTRAKSSMCVVDPSTRVLTGFV